MSDRKQVINPKIITMKKIIPILFLAFLVIACQKNTTVVISGKIKNPVDEPTGIRINYFERNDTITVNPDGTFYAEIELEDEHLAWFDHGHYAIPLYLVPGAKINLEFDAKEFEGWVYSNAQISGEKSEPSAFLYSLDLKMNKPLRQEISKMKVDSFATIMIKLENSTSKDIKEFIAKSSSSALFQERIKLKQRSELALKYLDYTNYHNYKNPPEKLIFDSFHAFIDAMPYNNIENCKEITEYWYFLYHYGQNIINKKMKTTGLKRETVAYIHKYADEIVRLDLPQDIKNDIGQHFLRVYSRRPDSLKQAYRGCYKDVIKNQEYIEEFEKTVALLENLKPGNVAPTFNYPDINGKMVSLESFRGNIVYIDVWATWCGPCKDEIPYLKKLEKELKNEDIVFVSISIDREKDKEAWKNMVKEKELGGCQLYASGDWESKIAKDYVIRGIPYFIIIDKEGKLAEVNASRPSKPETRDMLLKLVQS